MSFNVTVVFSVIVDGKIESMGVKRQEVRSDDQFLRAVDALVLHMRYDAEAALHDRLSLVKMSSLS